MRYACICLLLLCGTANTAQADWADFWRTPEQRAANAFAAGDHETLLNSAPDANWEGLARFQAGDYDAASRTFSEQAEYEQLNGDPEATHRALYNQGVSDVMAGRYEEALSNFDSVLSDDPGFDDAAHNREIVQKLIELQQQQEQQQDNQRQQGDQGEQGEQAEQSQDDGEQQQNSQQSGDSTQRDDQSEGQQDADQGNEQSAGADGDADDSEQGEAQSDAKQAAEDARNALAAEARQGEEQQGTDSEPSETVGASVEQRPLSETEQATEQWLRRIPDDPAGLLRRKLEQSHRNEFPEVRDAAKPW